MTKRAKPQESPPKRLWFFFVQFFCDETWNVEREELHRDEELVKIRYKRIILSHLSEMELLKNLFKRRKTK